MTIWQIGCGEEGRRYDEIFINYDVMLLGLGDYGKFHPNEYLNEVIKHESKADVEKVKRFATQPKVGNFVLLRIGYTIKAIGIIDSEYQWSPIFDDVYGWDLQHMYRVIWQNELTDELERLKIKLQIRNSFTEVQNKDVSANIVPLLEKCRKRTLKPLPAQPSNIISPGKLNELLCKNGLDKERALNITNTIEQQQARLNWYSINGKASARPSEHEGVAYFIVPFLKSLGWTAEQIAIEWNCIDVAIFNDSNNSNDCVLICEAKALSTGLGGSFGQAISYSQKDAFESCSNIICSDGARYYHYRKKSTKWAEDQEPDGYINLNKLRNDYTLFQKCKSLAETIISLMPESLRRKSD